MNVSGMLQFQISRIFFDVQDYHQKFYVLRLRLSENVQYAGSMFDFLTARKHEQEELQALEMRFSWICFSGKANGIFS